MAVNVPLITISELTEQTTAADTDCMVIGGADAKKIKWSSLKMIIKSLVYNWVYPVGTIYFSVDSTNPGSKFGGTWVAWGAGRVPIGVNTSDTDFGSVEKTGGNKNNTHNHYQTVGYDGAAWYISTYGNAPRTRVKSNISRYGIAATSASGTTREDSTYNETISVLQPYITCYMWKRTA